MNSYTVRQLADLVGGTVVGEDRGTILAARPLASAGPQDISFLEDDKHDRELAECHAAALLVKTGQRHGTTPVIEVADPLACFVTVFQHLHSQPGRHENGVHPQTNIHSTAKLGPDASVQAFVAVGAGTTIGARCQLHPGVVIGRNCKIGDDAILYPHAVIYDGCTLGNRVIVHANAVIGADGFGYRPQGGRHVKIPQLGGVVLGDDVEVGAGTMIDRGTFEPTRIGDGTKLDNLVQIGHNCKVGRHNLLAGQVGIGGSSTTGDYVVIAGQVGVADHVHVGDKAVLGAQAGVHKDIPSGLRVLGAPARPERDAKVILLSMDKLPELRQDVKRIKQHLGLAG